MGLLGLVCVAAALAASSFAAPQASAGERNGRFSERVTSMLRQLTVAELAGQMTQININEIMTGSVRNIDEAKTRDYARNYFIGSILNSPTSGVGPALNTSEWISIITDIQTIFLEEGVRIPIIYGLDSVHGANYVYGATLFPQQINGGASFNTALVEQMGAVTAKDTRVVGAPWNFAPIADLATHPAWARVYETFGEDPYLNSQMVSSIIKGMQGFPADLANPTKVAACMKHFIGYGNARTGKDRTPSWIPDRFLQQYYLPPFRAAVAAGVVTAMESYNDVNGEPVCASEKYLKRILRDDLGFQGMLVTDWAEVSDLNTFHKVAATQEDAARIVMQRTSVDMSMVPYDASFATYLISLVERGIVPVSRLEESAGRILQLKEDLGLLDNPFPDPASPLLGTVGSREDRDIALEMARESVILLQNRNNVLPLSRTAPNSVFVVGPVADSLTYLCGGWTIAWQGAPTDNLFKFGVTILDGIQAIAAENPQVEVTYRAGFSIQGIYSEAELAASVAAAASADVVVVALGETHYAEREGDIDDLALPQGQYDFVRALAGTGTPIVVVVAGGRTRLLKTLVTDASAILGAFLPCVEGGQAIAEILFGLVNPSGKLPISYPASPAATPLQYCRRVSDSGGFQWEFGHGLSYTTFVYSNLQLSSGTVTPNSTVGVSVTVRNSGQVAGKESVLLYLTDEYREVTPEVKLLKRFEKVTLAAGASTTVDFALDISDLVYYGIDENTAVYDTGAFIVSVGGLSARFTLV